MNLNKAEKFVVAFLGVTPRKARTTTDIEGMAKVNDIKLNAVLDAYDSLECRHDVERGCVRQVNGMGPSNRSFGFVLTQRGHNEFKVLMRGNV